MMSFSARTDIGRRRTLNEDAIFADQGLFVVCDGMGGHKAGEVASQLSIDALVAFVKRSGEDPELTWPYGFDPELSYNGNRLRTAIQLANRAVVRKAGSSEDYTGMGTTVAAVLIAPRRPLMTYAHVGDSRIYLIRAGGILRLTRDDSFASLGWDPLTPDDSMSSAMKNILTKALGAREDVDFEVAEQALSDGDVIALCSDGLTNLVPDPRILEIVTAHGADVAAACDALVDEANAQGGRDNISVILVRYAA
jgi:serine/threonine protein phosphatase PrpC